MDEPKIDEEFKALLPRLEPDETSKLTESLIAEGCREPVLVWEGLIVDGMNRADICWAEGIDFKTRDMQFESRAHVRLWIMRNQLGRRNLGTVDRARIGVALKNEHANIFKQNHRENSKVAILPPSKSRDLAAAEAGVSGRTIQDMEAVIESGDKDLNSMVDAKEVSISVASVVAKLPKKERAATVKAGPNAVKEKAKQLREEPSPETIAERKLEIRKEKAVGKFDHLPETIRPVFEEAGIFDEMLNYLTQVSKLFNQASGGNIERDKGKPMACGTALAKDYQEGAELLRKLRHFISSRKPENICAYCRGSPKEKAKCTVCRGGGWSTSFQWSRCTDNMKTNKNWNKNEAQKISD